MTVHCSKRSFNSAENAREANKNAPFRVRPYNCDICGKWHVANADKSGGSSPFVKEANNFLIKRPKLTDKNIVAELFRKKLKER